ncbi:MAG: nucleotide-binding protein [Gammaproteobacteria bacterium]|nr:nucleotide-binding protein [Gammaproteobacteria bacterium]
MKLHEIKNKLASSGYNISHESRINNNTGVKLELENGCIINAYDKGTHSIQGKNTDEVNQLLSNHPVDSLIPKEDKSPKKIFVVYGHDDGAKHQLEAMLRRWRLEPIMLDQLPSEGQTIIEKLEKYTSQVNFAVILATPDDEGFKAGRQDEKAFRARQNVVLELGMLLIHLGRKKVAILLKEQEKMERPSDIQGLIYIPFKDDIAKEAGVTLAKEMNCQGYNIDIKDL